MWGRDGEILRHGERRRERERALSATAHARECVFAAIDARTSLFLVVLVAPAVVVVIVVFASLYVS